ncbi:MAG: DUF3352 domain-containing protein [Proteobacteria bacterium]|nr:DUF3352 domain-containing protein [Pseudomonadota bacterium]MBU1232813.1 DUF3352 domain-containing protein [Pseudomonadota bacterium]MBU1420401.1 DUF3352 domain-containing protein [Pseudomonadota bacterium]MBU1454411.1 DUF3352 domain-containing protein [Pseudomonadota bacterium]
MKKVGVGLIFVFCCIALVVLLMSRQEEKVEVAEFLPENVLFYGEQQDFSAFYHAFQRSRLGRTLAHLDYAGTAAELGVSAEKIQEMEKHRQKISKIVEGRTFLTLLGKQFSIALFPAASFSATNVGRELEERVLLIARPRHNTHILKLLSPFFTADIQQATVQYGRHIITRYQVDKNRTISTATVKGLVVAGLDERLVRKSLDCYDEKKNTLQQNKAFQRLRQNLKRSKLFTYLSLPALYEQGVMISKNLPEEDRQAFLVFLKQWEGWGAAAYGAWQEKDLVQDKAMILFDVKKLDARVAQLCSVKPSTNNTLPMVPADVLFYYWSNTLNLPLVWEIYSSWMVDQPGDMTVLRQEVKDSTEVELDDILGMVGKEFAVIVKDVDSKGIPLPKAALVIQLKDPVAFFAVFEKLITAAEIPVSKEKYKNETIVYWGLAPQGGLQPAFSVKGEYLLLSNSIDMIKQIVKQQIAPKNNFLKNKGVKQVGSGLFLDNNSSAYIDIALLADVLKNLASWAGAIATLQGPEVAHTSQVVVEQIVLPLLDGAAMYSKLGSRSIIGKDNIVLESTTSIIQ